MSLINDDVLIGILLENRVLVAEERCREVRRFLSPESLGMAYT